MMPAHWDFVVAAYLLTYGALLSYGVGLRWRLRRGQKSHDLDGA